MTGIRCIAQQHWRLGTRSTALIDSQDIYNIISR